MRNIVIKPTVRDYIEWVKGQGHAHKPIAKILEEQVELFEWVLRAFNSMQQDLELTEDEEHCLLEVESYLHGARKRDAGRLVPPHGSGGGEIVTGRMKG